MRPSIVSHNRAPLARTYGNGSSDVHVLLTRYGVERGRDEGLQRRGE